jgi:NADH dehydrogenase FAD-containing subunit
MDIIQDNKQNILLLGDGFFARGFLHYINFNKFNITQIYKDTFINPQDLMYNLQRNSKYYSQFHFRNIFNTPNKTIQTNIDSLELLDSNKIKINQSISYTYDYLIIGLGAQKTLKTWSDEFNNIVDKTNLSISVVGMGPTGFEIASILSNRHKIHMFDMLSKDKVLNYVSSRRRDELLEVLDKYNISTTYESMYNPKDYNHDKTFFCVGTKPNNLIIKFTPINKYLQYSNNIYIGGDCANTSFIKTGQMAYQQGVYVAKRLNGEIPIDQPFQYISNGISLNIGYHKVLIEGHKYVPNGIYPDFIIKLYSMFFV